MDYRKEGAKMEREEIWVIVTVQRCHDHRDIRSLHISPLAVLNVNKILIRQSVSAVSSLGVSNSSAVKG